MGYQTTIQTVADANEMGRKSANQCHDKAIVAFVTRGDTDIHLHSFGDASGNGVAAAVYAVVFRPSAVNQGLVAAKARLAKQGLTIPRLELVSGHMAVNLISNVKTVLEGVNVSQQHCWLDSSVALH